MTILTHNIGLEWHSIVFGVNLHTKHKFQCDIFYYVYIELSESGAGLNTSPLSN